MLTGSAEPLPGFCPAILSAVSTSATKIPRKLHKTPQRGGLPWGFRVPEPRNRRESPQGRPGNVGLCGISVELFRGGFEAKKRDPPLNSTTPHTTPSRRAACLTRARCGVSVRGPGAADRAIGTSGRNEARLRAGRHTRRYWDRQATRAPRVSYLRNPARSDPPLPRARDTAVVHAKPLRNTQSAGASHPRPQCTVGSSSRPPTSCPEKRHTDSVHFRRASFDMG
jgi:hypothetical protein